ncbi:hypothetical protein L2E82_33830 [Cichorium intybus]|uniref:Uncharacterized protein n=1 Tax=Cichorium intybus TaxID=13427 RepID=A0ACB9BL83_CICIN|nr:hypothetical protein L2E82_33830 [Cichorium intybus]
MHKPIGDVLDEVFGVMDEVLADYFINGVPVGEAAVFPSTLDDARGYIFMGLEIVEDLLGLDIKYVFSRYESSYFLREISHSHASSVLFSCWNHEDSIVNQPHLKDLETYDHRQLEEELFLLDVFVCEWDL